MSVRDYSHKFNSLTRYVLDIVQTMRARVYSYLDGLADHLIIHCKVASLSDDVDISRIQVFDQTTEELSQLTCDTHREREQSKRSRTICSYRETHGNFRPPFHRYQPRPVGSFSPQVQGPRFNRYSTLGPGWNSGHCEGSLTGSFHTNNTSPFSFYTVQ